MADNKNLFDGESQIYILLKAPFRASQTTSASQANSIIRFFM